MDSFTETCTCKSLDETRSRALLLRMLNVWTYRRVKWAYQISLGLAVLGGLSPSHQLRANESIAQYSITARGHKDGLPSTLIDAIAQTYNGFLWLGSADGLVRFDGLQFTTRRSIQPNESPRGPAHALCPSSHDGLWLSTGRRSVGLAGSTTPVNENRNSH